MELIVDKKRKKLLFLIAEDWYFFSHRLDLAVSAKNANYDVTVVARVKDHAKLIEDVGLRLIPLRQLKRSSFNPFRELLSLFEIILIYRREKPDLVHQVAIKPVIYGSLAAKLTSVPFVVNALGGLGFTFSSNKYLARVIQPFLIKLFRYLFNNPSSRLILQNDFDVELITNKVNVESSYIKLIRGAGVSLENFSMQPLPKGAPIVMLASRMLWDKGVGEFVAAAKILRSKGVDARFVIVGDCDEESPSTISRHQLNLWHQEGDIEWWGYQSNMALTLSRAYLVCLPTYYGEGVPKVLLEAMSCGRAIITTDIPGCRDLISNSINGFLIRPKNINDLTYSLLALLKDSSLCEAMGEAGRKIVESKYAVEYVIEATLNVYEDLFEL